MASKYKGNAEFYLNIINKKLGIDLRLSGQDTRDGLTDNESGADIGHLFPNMSQLYSAIFTCEQIIGLREKNDKQHLQSMETKAHYWETLGKPLYEKQQERLRKKRDKEN